MLTFYFELHGKIEAEDVMNAWDKLYDIFKKNCLDAEIDNIEGRQE